MSFRGVNPRASAVDLRRSYITGGNTVLPFSAGTFANASSRYILAQNPSTGLYEMTGPFGSNVLATRNISGDVYGLFEKQYATENTYSEVFRNAISNWTNANSDVDDDYTTSPIGDSTADRIYENTATNLHGAVTGFSADGSNRYYGLIFVKAAERTKCYLNFAGTQFVGSGPPECKFDLTTKLPYDNSIECTDYGMIELVDGWFMVYISAVSDVAGTGYFRFYLVDGSDQISYTGDGTSGICLWGANVIKADHLTSYIQAIASTVIKSPDVFYFPVASVPAWLKGSQNQAFSFNMIPNYTTAQITANKFLFSVDGTENVECYLDTSGNVNIDVDSVSAFQSSAPLGIGLRDVGKISIVPNNGSNCQVVASGFTSGNFDETGTSFSMQSDGDLYQACRHTTNDLQLDGLMSEFRKGLV